MKFFKVFLGGSCNPTAWRRDQSIPLLEREGVTYYNPVRKGGGETRDDEMDDFFSYALAS